MRRIWWFVRAVALTGAALLLYLGAQHLLVLAGSAPIRMESS